MVGERLKMCRFTPHFQSIASPVISQHDCLKIIEI